MGTEIIPYLEFHGDCEEAVNRYINLFGGEILFLSRWSEDNSPGAPERAGMIMHMEFTLGRTRLSAADVPDSPEGDRKPKLMVHLDAKEEALRLVSLLAEGGTRLSPLQPHPAPDDGGCGSITEDRFGCVWIITCPNPDRRPGRTEI